MRNVTKWAQNPALYRRGVRAKARGVTKGRKLGEKRQTDSASNVDGCLHLTSFCPLVFCNNSIKTQSPLSKKDPRARRWLTVKMRQIWINDTMLLLLIKNGSECHTLHDIKVKVIKARSHCVVCLSRDTNPQTLLSHLMCKLPDRVLRLA